MSLENIEEITDINKLKRLFKIEYIQFETLCEDLLFQGIPIPNEDTKELEEYLERIRIRINELSFPEYTDGVVDLYRDYGTKFTITESNKKIPIGVISYNDTTRPIPGNISYKIYKKYRGHHYALRALRILGEVLLEKGIKSITVTASDKSNIPSIKTIEEFGGILRNERDRITQGPVPYICDLPSIYSKK